MKIRDALDFDFISVPLCDSTGKTAAEYVFVYPPGVPVILPGETITDEMLVHIDELMAASLNIIFTYSKNGFIRVLC